MSEFTTTTTTTTTTTATSQSSGLSDRHLQMHKDGRTLIDDSAISEISLTKAIEDIVMPYTVEKFSKLSMEIEIVKKMSLFDCQVALHKLGGPTPNEENKNVYMKPDGGIIVAIRKTLDENGQIVQERIPILITEDKVQGTNDNLHAAGKPRQATGNAIERGAKNIRGAEMIFGGLDVFPYVLFASGCDFHSSETIAKRIEMFNFGYANHYIELSPDMPDGHVWSKLHTDVLPAIDIKKKTVAGSRFSTATICVKAHKWNEMKHDSSRWKTNEIGEVCKKVIDQVFDSMVEYVR